MSKIKPKDDILEAMGPRVWYEWAMFNESYILLFKVAPNIYSESLSARQNQGLLNNAAYESFLVHVRTLFCFLQRERRENDRNPEDCFAQDYNDQWTKLRPEQSFIKEDKIDKIGYSLAHLSYKRIDTIKAKWSLSDLTRFYTDIQNTWRKFFKSLPPEKQKWFYPNKFPTINDIPEHLR